MTRTKKPTRGHVWAIKRTDIKPSAIRILGELHACRFMPDVVGVVLDGRPGKVGMLALQGWTLGSTKPWDLKRLQAKLKEITAMWVEDHGRCWRLEIRAV